MEKQEFYIGQIFEGSYPPEAAYFCNANHAFIDVIGEHRYEIKEVPEPTAEQIKANQIAELKSLLVKTDYIVIKIAESDNAEEQAQLREEYAEIIANRKAWRAEINELEG